MTLEDTRFEDMLEREYGGSEKLLRFHMRQRIIVRSSDVDKVSTVSKESASEGAENINDSSMSYHFTRLDQLRPLMLSQSMESARTVAHRMAQDCKVSLGDVRSIHQGVFTIVGRDHHDDGQGYDNGESLYKKVRIVSTISYFLK